MEWQLIIMVASFYNLLSIMEQQVYSHFYFEVFYSPIDLHELQQQVTHNSNLIIIIATIIRIVKPFFLLTQLQRHVRSMQGQLLLLVAQAHCYLTFLQVEARLAFCIHCVEFLGEIPFFVKQLQLVGLLIFIWLLRGNLKHIFSLWVVRCFPEMVICNMRMGYFQVR